MEETEWMTKHEIEQEAMKILNARCVSCHTTTAQIPLTTYAQVANTVWPGDAPASILYDSVKTGRMPKTGAPLTAMEIGKIEGWITAGALNN